MARQRHCDGRRAGSDGGRQSRRERGRGAKHRFQHFEILTLRQTQKAPPIPIVLFDKAYWQRVIDFEALAAEQMIDRTNLELFDYAESAEELWQNADEPRIARAHTRCGWCLSGTAGLCRFLRVH